MPHDDHALADHSPDDGDHRHHHRAFTIVVNTRSVEWPEKEISYEQVIELAWPGEPFDPQGTTVEYSRGHGPDKPLTAGHSVRVKDGMIFDAERTNRS